MTEDKSKYQRKTPTIESFGVIVYATENGIKHFLLYKRRDSFAYTEFMRGIWSNYEGLKRLFSGMTQEERDRIQNYTFTELWDDHWVSKSYKVYKESFTRAKKKYENCREVIPDLLKETIPTNSQYLWGFPKGKKNGHEEDKLECALREFEEETRIPKTSLTVVDGQIFVEKYKGTDCKNYSTEYFLCIAEGMTKMEYMKLEEWAIRKNTISEEASELGWFTFEEAKGLLDPIKLEMLETIVSS